MIQQTKISKTTVWVLGTLMVLAITLWAAVAQAPDQRLHIYFLNVGQGDSAYVRSPTNFDLLIDGGPDKSVLSELGAVMPFYDKKIDLVVLSHPHADHVSGLIEVLKRYEIGEIWLTDAVHTSSEYLEFLKLIKEKEIKTEVVAKGKKKSVPSALKSAESVALEVLWPEESYKNKTVDNLNDTSIVLKFSYGDFSALFAGDIESEVQQKLLSNNETMKQFNNVAVLKIPHHGSANAAYEPFIKLIKPEIAIISVGENNKFGHPAASTLKKYEVIGAKIFRTDRDGRVEIISDGKTYWAKPEK